MCKSRGDPATSTSLCTTCGLCCSGVLFDSTPLADDEVEGAASLGFRPYVDPAGQPRFDQPCPHLRDTRCSVYELRPRSCRAFECEVLKKLNAGELTPDEAAALVNVAKAMIEEVRPLMLESGGPITPRRWGRLLDTWSEMARAGAATPVQARLVLELARLNRFLDEHFRSSDRHVVKPKCDPGV